MALIRRFHLTHLRSLIVLVCNPRPSLKPHCSPSFSTPNFSQTFHRTLSVHSQTLSTAPHFPTFKPSSLQPLYDPIDFREFDDHSSLKYHLGSVELVELVEKTKVFGSKKEAIEFIVGSGINCDANKVYFAIWLLRNDWQLALLVFELNGKWGFVNEKILGLIVWVLGTHHKFDIAWSLIRDFNSIVDTQRAMLAIIERYAAANYPKKALKTFSFMETLSLCLDQNVMYSLLSALCKYGNVEEAEDFMLLNKKLFPLTTEGYNIILHAWCTISIDIKEVRRVWRGMESYCITPDAISYTHMISCVSRKGLLFDTLQIYDEMKRCRWVPGIEVYNSLMYGMVRESCVSEALKLLEKIKELGLQPDSNSYNCLITPLCETGMLEEAKALVFTMSQEGIEPTVETYKALITEGDLDSTLDILQKMKNDNVGPDSCTFLAIFDRFFELKKPENAMKIWAEMGYFGVHPESLHYSSLISGLVNCGCLIEAKEMHTEMISNGFVDDPKLKKLLQGPEKDNDRERTVPALVNDIDRLDRSLESLESRCRIPRGREKRRDKSLHKKRRGKSLYTIRRV